jgi:hypothetical protein
MSDKQTDDHIPEFVHIDTATRRRELAAAGASANQRLDSIKQSLKLPNLLAVETKTEKLIPGPGCIERFQVLGLAVGPNQSLQKKIFEQWNDGGICYRVNYTIGFQFMGYGAYCLSFEKDAGNTNLFNNFFRDIAGYGVNLHRTILFTKETYENPNATQVQRLLLNGDGHTTSPDPNYLANLDRLVVAAKSQGIVVQVCLFMHHSVAGTPGAGPPLPVVLTGSGYDRYRAFYNTASSPTSFKPMQTHLIDGVVAKLLPHWNVVYEIGNELRVPNPNAAYGEPHLKAWIDWAAGQIRTKDANHLITTSTGTDNEAGIDNLANIKFCSFHQGQWTANLNAACDRANSYAGKHVVFDDDGSARPIASVKAWAKAALDTRGGCRCSFNHKGISPFGAYNANWINTAPPAGESKPLDALIAMRDARAASTSPCARE